MAVLLSFEASSPFPIKIESLNETLNVIVSAEPYDWKKTIRFTHITDLFDSDPFDIYSDCISRKGDILVINEEKILEWPIILKYKSKQKDWDYIYICGPSYNPSMYRQVLIKHVKELYTKNGCFSGTVYQRNMFRNNISIQGCILLNGCGCFKTDKYCHKQNCRVKKIEEFIYAYSRDNATYYYSESNGVYTPSEIYHQNVHKLRFFSRSIYIKVEHTGIKNSLEIPIVYTVKNNLDNLIRQINFIYGDTVIESVSAETLNIKDISAYKVLSNILKYVSTKIFI